MTKFKRRAVIVENDSKFRELLSSMVEASSSCLLVNQYQECEEALDGMKQDMPEIIVMGLDFSRMPGIEGIQEFKRISPHVNILVITDYDDEDIVFKIISAGAGGYLLKQTWVSNFLQYLNEIAMGGSPLSPSIARIIISSMQASGVSPLTGREAEVLKLITKGNSYTEISLELKISKETSKTHIKNIYRKLNANSKSEVVKKAFEQRIVPSGWNPLTVS